MAFRFQKKEELEKGFHRIANEQFERALLKWSADDHVFAIHETRKCFKRLRALLRLVSSALPRHEYKTEDVRLRDLARQLSASRDRQVMLETIARLRADAGPAESKSLDALQKAVAATPHVRSPGKASVHARKFAKALRTAARHFNRLELKGDGFDTVGIDFEATYRKGRTGMRLLLKHETEELSHEWRKLVQAHWRQLSLLSAAWPEFFEARIAVARRLSDQLGYDHDLAGLSEFAKGAAANELGRQGLAGVKKLIRNRQQVLRQMCFADGRLLYADPPKQLRRTIERYWQIAADGGSCRPPCGGRIEYASSRKSPRARKRRSFPAAHLKTG
ncbi:MAG: CHAD domain-containing protein [Alphaproteobacteria bacterium]|nr:CHAD domain-containing protein [Alphaproteobacteria bacterium]